MEFFKNRLACVMGILLPLAFVLAATAAPVAPSRTSIAFHVFPAATSQTPCGQPVRLEPTNVYDAITQYDPAGGFSIAAKREIVIGKMEDIAPGKLKAGEKSLVDRLPNQGTPKANWAQNSSVLRQEMGRGLPIRDASTDRAGTLVKEKGFLRLERNLLRNHGWVYSPKTQLWTPPAAAK